MVMKLITRIIHLTVMWISFCFFYPNDGAKNNYDGGNVDECDDDGDFDNGSADIDKKWQ